MSARYGVDMTYLAIRAFLGPHDVGKAVHAFSMSWGPVVLARLNPDKSAVH